uniref:Uncharacterized protein n=1 Tax=Romanomermis culicivorax TaxID=13658 RepID=A0A915JJB0_ROMCU
MNDASVTFHFFVDQHARSFVHSPHISRRAENRHDSVFVATKREFEAIFAFRHLNSFLLLGQYIIIRTVYLMCPSDKSQVHFGAKFLDHIAAKTMTGAS